MLVAVGAVRLKWWGVVWLSFHFLYLAVSFPGWRLSVVGYFVFRYRSFFRYIWQCSGFVYIELLIFLICYRWFRQSRNLEDQEPLLEQTRLEHQKVDLETRIEYLEADVLHLRSDYVFMEDGEKKDAIFSSICGLDSEIFQLKAELATVNSLLSSY